MSEDKKGREEKGKTARDRAVRQYSEKKMLDEYEKLYLRLCNDKR